MTPDYDHAAHDARKRATLAQIARHYADRIGELGMGELLAAAALVDRFGTAHDPSRPAAVVLRAIADELDAAPVELAVEPGGTIRARFREDLDRVFGRILDHELDPRDAVEPRSVLDHDGRLGPGDA